MMILEHSYIKNLFKLLNKNSINLEYNFDLQKFIESYLIN